MSVLLSLRVCIIKTPQSTPRDGKKSAEGDREGIGDREEIRAGNIFQTTRFGRANFLSVPYFPPAALHYNLPMKKLSIFITAMFVLLGSAFLLAQGPRGRGPAGADPPTPVFWSSQHIKDLAAEMKPNVNPTTHNVGMVLIPSANLIYREGDSGSEIHEKVADIIFVHEGEGTILVGGKMIGGQQDRPDEIRGTSIEGGTRYPIKTGDSIYIPANMPHQFFVEKGKHFVITIVKVTPQR